VWERLFRLSENGTTVRTELSAGLTTFLTMAYIIFVQPAVLSGRMFHIDTGLDYGAVMMATCLATALATLIMGLYARYPIAQAPGMGENFFFVLALIPAAQKAIEAQVAQGSLAAGATQAWQVALGVIFISGVLFLILSLLGVREMLLDAISPSMRNGIAVGIGLFIAFIGLQTGTLILSGEGTPVQLNYHFASPDLIVFFFGFLFTAGLMARRVRGAIVWGMVAALLLTIALRYGIPHLPAAIADADIVKKSELMATFKMAEHAIARPPSMAPTLFKMDLIGAVAVPMIPFIFIFLFMNLFDTLGTLIGVGEQAGFIKDNKLPRAKQALVSDAIATTAGAAMGTSTVTSYIESAAGVAHGGRTGLTAVTVAVLFLLAMFFSPIVEMVGSYRPITAPALVVVGSMMIRNVVKIDWLNDAEAMPAFIIILGIPLTYSIADGLALGFIAYPLVKLLAGQGRDVKWLMYVLAVLLLTYFVFVRVHAG
jgi:adenine/guanine/hypoxanthine permease